MKLKNILTIAVVFFILAGCSSKNEKLFSKAVLMNKKGNVEGALGVYNTILRNDPNFYSAIVNRAIIYEKLGEKAKAEADYLKAWNLRPNQPELLNNMGSFYLSIKKPFTAISLFDSALEIKPDYYLALINRAAANEYLGYLNRASEDLETAISLMPTGLLAIVNKAIIDYRLFNYESSVRGFSAAMELEPNNAKHYYRRGKAFRMWDKYADALEDFDTAVRMDPKYVPARYERALLLFKSGDYQAALGDLDQLKAINNQYVPAYELAGDIVAIEDPIAATANYLVAKKLDPNPTNQRRYNAKIALMASDKGRERVIARTFDDR